MIRQTSNWLIRLSAAGLIAMTAIIGWQVFGRFVLDSSPSWTEQASLILMIWYVFFAAAAGVYEGFHIRIELLESMSNPANARRIRIAIQLIVAALGLVLLVFGSQLVWLVRDHVVPSLGISRGAAYLPLPISGLLMAIFALVQAKNDQAGSE
jgi:TRAP-type C4-dicarboxylate transport system permease small subunit